MVDACEIDDCVDKITLLRSTVHLIGVRYLNRTAPSVIITIELRALCRLLAVRRGESLRLGREICQTAASGIISGC